MVPVERIELPTFGLQNRCSTAELNRHAPNSYQRRRRRTRLQKPFLRAFNFPESFEIPWN